MTIQGQAALDLGGLHPAQWHWVLKVRVPGLRVSLGRAQSQLTELAGQQEDSAGWAAAAELGQP